MRPAGDARKIETPSAKLNRGKDLEGTRRGQSLVPQNSDASSEGVVLRGDFGTFGKTKSTALPSISGDVHRAALTPHQFEKAHTQW
ncbi:MAG TPA: hypothetical protein VH208_13640, partial [Myxococcaceae bacterium]|nr:hypothetical protein [Myxococcaceae bacterium]